MPALRVATWNINSLRLRRPAGPAGGSAGPDVICLQETKVPDALFPGRHPYAAGLPAPVFRGMKGYNGVAILSRVPMTCTNPRPTGAARRLPASGSGAPDPGWPNRTAQLLRACRRRRPGPDENPKYGHKLEFMAESRYWFAARTNLPERCWWAT